MVGSGNPCRSNSVRRLDRKSTRLNSSHQIISYAVFCLKKKKQQQENPIDYIYEQDPVDILDDLIPRNVDMEFSRALLKSNAAEHTAPMTGMDASHPNAA